MQVDKVRSFGQWIKQQRKELDFTQAVLSEQIGCAVDTLRRIESGRLRPSRQLAELLAAALEVHPEERDDFMQWARRPIPQDRSQPTAPESQEGGYAHPPTNLPSPLTPFIGRERELEQARSFLWRAGVRLLTLTGPPGVGKTRLSMEVAALLLGDFGDGVYFVPLAPINDPQQVIPTIARTLGVKEAAGKPVIESLKAHLRDKRLLLVLDNFEQVTGAALPLVDLLTACPDVKTLVTSREVLRVRGEKAMPVPTMEVPSSEYRVPSDEESLIALKEVDSVALFLQRAQDVRFDFALTPANAPAIAAICRLLEGLPLAIELAASRMDILSPQRWLDRLASRSSLSDGGARDLPPHQATLRQAIDWSYDLLSHGEQILFRCLGVFVGGCALDAVEAVCDPGGKLLVDALESAQSLLRKSLLMQHADASAGESVFTMLQVIREYARERLAECRDEQDVRRLHAQYYLALAEAAEPLLTRTKFKLWSRRLDREMDNLRVVLDWAEAHDVELGLRLAGALWLFWETSARTAEGREWLNKLLSLPGASAPTLGQAKALRAAAFLSVVNHRDLPGGQALGHEALQIARALGDKRMIAYAILNVGYPGEGDYPENRPLLDEALVLGHELGDQWCVGSALHHKGVWEALDRNYEKADSLLSEAVRTLRQTGEPFALTGALKMLARVKSGKGNTSEAQSIFEEIIRIKTDWGNMNYLAGFLRSAAHAAIQHGDFQAAKSHLRQSIDLFSRLDSKVGIASCMMVLASLTAEERHWEEVAQLSGVVDSLPSENLAALDSALWEEYIQTKREAQAQLGDDSWFRIWEEGRRMTSEEAVKYAIEALGCE